MVYFEQQRPSLLTTLLFLASTVSAQNNNTTPANILGIPLTNLVYIGAGIGGAIVICAIVTAIILFKKFYNQQ